MPFTLLDFSFLNFLKTQFEAGDFPLATFSLDVKLNFLNLQETEAEPPAEEKPQEEEVDIDLNDPEVQNAAVKIQV